MPPPAVATPPGAPLRAGGAPGGFGRAGRRVFVWVGCDVTGVNAVGTEIGAGGSLFAMARRLREFLMHWDEATLAAGRRMLHDAHIGPFTRLRDDP